MEIKELLKMNNIRYNMAIICEILSATDKVTSFDLMSKNIRERYLKDGYIEKTKITKLYKEIGIGQEYFTGEKRFFLPACEEVFESNPHLLSEKNFVSYNNYGNLAIKDLPEFNREIDKTVKAYRRGEFIRDINLDRFLYYINNGNSIEGHRRASNITLKSLYADLEELDFQKIISAKESERKKFIKAAGEIIILCQAAQIMADKKGKKEVAKDEK